MKIYTKTGDDGETGLFAGPRVPKDHPRVEVCGALDELNAVLGQARTAGPAADMDGVLCRAQHELFALGAELGTPQPEAAGLVLVQEEQIAWLERAIDHYEADLPPLREFILPGGTLLAATLHVARSVCRRAERRIVTLSRTEPGRISDRALRYVNRLGDLLFVLARTANQRARQEDVIWRKPATPAD
jgi:cob(I)alamin adenosyltransferase